MFYSGHVAFVLELMKVILTAQLASQSPPGIAVRSGYLWFWVGITGGSKQKLTERRTVLPSSSF